MSKLQLFIMFVIVWAVMTFAAFLILRKREGFNKKEFLLFVLVGFVLIAVMDFVLDPFFEDRFYRKHAGVYLREVMLK